jgi:hypothetical protein
MSGNLFYRYHDQHMNLVKHLTPGLKFFPAEGKPKLCENGYHAVPARHIWTWCPTVFKSPHVHLWEVELSGDVVKGPTKYAGKNMTLIRRIFPKELSRIGLIKVPDVR